MINLCLLKLGTNIIYKARTFRERENVYMHNLHSTANQNNIDNSYAIALKDCFLFLQNCMQIAGIPVTITFLQYKH